MPDASEENKVRDMTREDEGSPKQEAGGNDKRPTGEVSQPTEYFANIAGWRCVRSLFRLNEQTSTIKIL